MSPKRMMAVRMKMTRKMRTSCPSPPRVERVRKMVGTQSQARMWT